MRSARRRSFVERRLKAEFLRFVRLNGVSYLKCWGVALLTAAVLVPAGVPAYVTGACHGFLLMFMIAVPCGALLLAGEGAHLVAGSYGEEFTRDAVEAARKRGYVWSAVHNVEVGFFDVDHVVLSPAGVLALETKWRFARADDLWLRQATEQAERAAGKARLVLQSKDIG